MQQWTRSSHRRTRCPLVIKVEVSVGQKETPCQDNTCRPVQHECMRVISNQRWKREGRGHVKELQRRKSAKCPHSLRESKSGKWRDTYVKQKQMQSLGHMTTCLCVRTFFHTQENTRRYFDLSMLTVRTVWGWWKRTTEWQTKELQRIKSTKCPYNHRDSFEGNVDNTGTLT